MEDIQYNSISLMEAGYLMWLIFYSGKSIKSSTGGSNSYSKRSSSRGKSPPIVSAAVSSTNSHQTSNANSTIDAASPTCLNPSLASSSSLGAPQKAVVANLSGAVQTNSSNSVVSAATTK